jgi:hypothetical protein
VCLTDLPQAIQGKIDTFSDADAGSAHQPQSVEGKIVSFTEFAIQAQIVFWGKRVGQIAGARRKVLTADKVRGERMAVID